MYWSDILQEAQDIAHQPTLNGTAGAMWSATWWGRRINRAKDILYQATGCYQTAHAVDTIANVREYTVPTTLCWGITSARYDNSPLDVFDVYTMDEDYAGWERGTNGTPKRMLVRNPKIIIDPMPDRSVTAGTDIAGTSSAGVVGLGFTTQPDNDGIEVGSSSASDTTQTLTVYYVTSSSADVCTEEIALNGTTYVSSSATNMDDILGAELDAACAGNVTIREASGNQTVTTITAGNTTAGFSAVTASAQSAGKVHPTVRAVDNTPACTARIGLIGTDIDGGAVTDCCTYIAGTTATKFPVAMDTVTYLLLGAVPTTNSVLVEVGAGLELWGGAFDADISDPSALTTTSPSGLPAQFHYLLAVGAAQLALMIANYEDAEKLRKADANSLFGAGLQELQSYLDGYSVDRAQPIRVEKHW